jgi:hypothetical protein
VETNEAGEYSIRFLTENFSHASELYFIDKEEGSATAIEGMTDYKFTAEGPQMSYRGRFFLSPTPYLPEATVANSVRFYPNPVKSYLNVRVTTPGDAMVSMLNANGSIVFEKSIAGEDVIDMRNFSTGIYIIKVQNAEGTVVRKIIKTDSQ